MEAKKLNLNDLALVQAILYRVFKCMEYDSDLEKYIDAGNFCMSLNEEQMQHVVKILQKINNNL
jgi:hypothetical protein